MNTTVEKFQSLVEMIDTAIDKEGYDLLSVARVLPQYKSVKQGINELLTETAYKIYITELYNIIRKAKWGDMKSFDEWVDTEDKLLEIVNSLRE